MDTCNLAFSWAAVKELCLISFYKKEALLFTVYHNMVA